MDLRLSLWHRHDRLELGGACASDHGVSPLGDPAPCLCLLRGFRESNYIASYRARYSAWKARWDGQIPDTMPLPTDPDPVERLRYILGPNKPVLRNSRGMAWSDKG